MRRAGSGYIVVATAALLALACASPRPLMPTPALYTAPDGPAIFEKTSPERRTTGVDLFFVTDRGAETAAEAPLPYGQERSNSLAFGSARVELVPDLDWETLASESRLAERTRDVNMELGAVREMGRFPEEPYPFKWRPSGLIRDPLVVREHRETRRQLHEELEGRLARSPKKEVVLYVHGFNETFESAAFTAAELCHFLGREHVCAFFTWPASASGNFLTSYTTTTESAEFSVPHLRKTIRLIADTPGVEGIHLLAHSRGSALLLSAIRELVIEAVAHGVAPVDQYKLINLVLMAPDIDGDVAMQKLEIFVSDPDMLTHWQSDNLPAALRGRFTIYGSPGDRALRVSQILFRSRRRVGQISFEDMDPVRRKKLEGWAKLDVVIERRRTDWFGHAYFVSDPQVSADLIQLIRYGRQPGEPGRLLEPLAPRIWAFPKE